MQGGLKHPLVRPWDDQGQFDDRVLIFSHARRTSSGHLDQPGCLHYPARTILNLSRISYSLWQANGVFREMEVVLEDGRIATTPGGIVPYSQTETLDTRYQNRLRPW